MLTAWRSFWKKRRPTRPIARTRLELEALEDRLAPAAFIVTTTADNGDNITPTAGSLRAAVKAVNDGTNDGITFNIGAGNQQIKVKTRALPAIANAVTIDGSTRAGQTIEVTGDASLAGTNAVGLDVAANGSKIVGVTIDTFQSDGILIDNAANCTIGATTSGGSVTFVKNGQRGAGAGGGNGIHVSGGNATGNTIIACFLGTNSSSGAGAAFRNVGNGILIDNGASQTTVGGLDDAERNVISNNANAGVYINGANNNTIAGNYIGTDVNGTRTLGNVDYGVVISGNSTDNKIGAVVATTKGVIVKPANVISGNGAGNGVSIYTLTATRNLVQGNYIGVDKTGLNALANSYGVVLNNTTGNTIGGSVAGALNVISSNTNSGVWIGNGSQNNRVLNNNIGIGPDPDKKTVKLGNGGDAVTYDATTSGNIVKGCRIFNNRVDEVRDPAKKNKTVDPNSASDNGFGIDTGSQDGAPVLASAVVNGNSILISGSLASTPNSTFLLEFFGNSQADPSGYGQGEQYLGNLNVTTDANGNASFTVVLGAVFGSFVSATSTGTADDGYTSNFSNDVFVNGLGSTATVGGQVWSDQNGNGLIDPGEPGVPGVLVNLYDGNGALLGSTVTDANGNYQFTNLAPGDYYLQFVAPSSYIFTQPYQGDTTLDSHADPIDGTTETFTLSAGEVYPFYSAGLLATGGGAARRH